MEIEVRRSRRRRKTVQARMIDGVLQIAIPDHLSIEEERHWVELMEAKFQRSETTEAIDLRSRAGELARRFHLKEPADIVWSERQKTLWGSCTPATGRVRIATRTSGYPDWVIDYVIIHELAHLEVPDHSAAFWKLVDRYPEAARARGYLEAKSDGR